jgi:chromosome segregation ATPase
MALQPSARPAPLRLISKDRAATTSAAEPKQPRTPGSKITQFFNWKTTASADDDSSTTDESDNGLSPVASPTAVSPQTSRYSNRSIPHGMDIGKANDGLLDDGGFESPNLHQSLTDHDLAIKAGQLEGELREISCELASSIKREMELEDLVEKLQYEASGSTDETRTSDYYSDSSSSSARYAGLDGTLKVEDLEKVKRHSEQERARLKVDLSQKWQEERERRKVLETHIQSLEGQVAELRRERVDLSSLSLRSKELEASLEDTRRRLAEERQIKQKFEKLSTTLRTDLEQERRERSNLRDEVVPQLQAKLLAKNVEPRPPSFDFVRMQQEIQALKNENAALREARKSQQEAQHSQPRFNTISEEGEPPSPSMPRSPVGLSRSNSLARAPSRSGGVVRSSSLSRSNSIGGKSPIENREILADRMKDVEFQRDALHSAMKALLARQEAQSKEYQKQIRVLEQERDRALLPPTPRKQGYEKEVRNLREEINQLRHRADEALNQKLQCEKGLGGLKMDLDRSEQETSTLRRLLKEHDIALPEHLSDSLQHAYNQLQQDRMEAEARIEDDTISRSLEEEQRLAEQLKESAERSEGLARQMAAQLATNQALRTRLAQAVGRGEKNQTASTNQITELETKLRGLEDTVTLAQQQSETAVMKHEEEIRILNDAHNAQLQRLKAVGYRSPTTTAATNRKGLSPLVSPIFAQRSPKLDQTTSGPGVRLDQALKTEQLEKKVAELEAALENADSEMQQVVGRMNVAQIEVMELQTERYV